MSLSEIKTAVDALSAEELTELAAFVRERENRAWDQQSTPTLLKAPGSLRSRKKPARMSVLAGCWICRDRQD